MKEKMSETKQFKGLRERAESFLRKTGPAVKNMPADNVRHLVEDLGNHQVELEIQNEDLRRSQLELIAARDKYADLYDFSPVGYFTISEKGMVSAANLTGAAMLGVERNSLIGKPFSRFIKKDSQTEYYLHYNLLFDKKTKQTCILQFL